MKNAIGSVLTAFVAAVIAVMGYPSSSREIESKHGWTELPMPDCPEQSSQVPWNTSLEGSSPEARESSNLNEKIYNAKAISISDLSQAFINESNARSLATHLLQHGFKGFTYGSADPTWKHSCSKQIREAIYGNAIPFIDDKSDKGYSKACNLQVQHGNTLTALALLSGITSIQESAVKHMLKLQKKDRSRA